jgi:hypothetical protein
MRPIHFAVCTYEYETYSFHSKAFTAFSREHRATSPIIISQIITRNGAPHRGRPSSYASPGSLWPHSHVAHGNDWLHGFCPHYSVRIQPDISSSSCDGSVEASTESTSILSVDSPVLRSAPLRAYRTSSPWPTERRLDSPDDCTTNTGTSYASRRTSSASPVHKHVTTSTDAVRKKGKAPLLLSNGLDTAGASMELVHCSICKVPLTMHEHARSSRQHFQTGHLCNRGRYSQSTLISL